MSKRVSQLPPTIGIKDPETRQYLDTLTNILDQRSGNTDKDSPDRFLTAADLTEVANGMSRLSGGSPSAGGSSSAGGYSTSEIIERLSESIKSTALYRILGEPFAIIQDRYSAEVAGLQAELLTASNQILSIQDGSTDIVIKTDSGSTSIRALKNTVYDPVTGLPAAQAAIGEINNISLTSTSASAKKIASLVAQVNDPSTGLAAANANITAINNVSATSTSASARQLSGLSSVVYDPSTGLAKANASILALNDVSATSSSANARYLFAVNSSVGQKNKIFFQGVAPASTASYTLREADIWFDSSNKNKMYRWNGLSWLESSDQRIAESSSLIVTEQDTRSNKDNSLAQAINTVWSSIGGSSALIQDSALAQVSPAAVQATKWNQVQAAVTDPNTGKVSSTSIKQDLTSYASKVDGTLNSTYSLKAQITSGGQTIVGGFALAATSGAGSSSGPTIDFGVRADTFWVGGLNAAKKIPFVIRTSSSTLPDGTPVAAGVYMDTAMVDQLYGTYINAGLLDAAKIYTGSQYVDRTSKQDLPVVATARYATGLYVPTPTASQFVAPLSASLRIYGPNYHSSVPYLQRCRNTYGGRAITFLVSASAVVDHYLSLWYRICWPGAEPGWTWIGTAVEPQSDYGSNSLTAAVEAWMNNDNFIEFSVSPTNSSLAAANGGKIEVRNLNIVVTAVNL